MFQYIKYFWEKFENYIEKEENESRIIKVLFFILLLLLNMDIFGVFRTVDEMINEKNYMKHKLTTIYILSLHNNFNFLFRITDWFKILNFYDFTFYNEHFKNVWNIEFLIAAEYPFQNLNGLYSRYFFLYKMFFYSCVYNYKDYFYHLYIYNINLPIFFYFGVLFIFSTILSLFLLSYLGFYGVFILNLVTLILFWISLIFYFNSFFLDNIIFKINLGKWFVLNINQKIFFEIFIDSISYSFMFLTVSISVFVYIYTFSYFRYEPNVERLILLINLFVISMVCLVTSGNFFVLFLGWELIGLTSFFLINFWSTRISTLKAAFKAFVFNKFSDVSLLIAIIIIFFTLNDSNINSFLFQISYFNNYYINFINFKFNLIEVISFFFIICSFIKSAQFGFHIWLPDSMEAPVPASALIHSATLVSAGVFILLRLTPLFEYSYFVFFITPIVGSFTAFFGGLCSTYQSDIKKILAYSTISHCGFLMVCYSTFIPEYTILYLYIHGFFKAAVFLCVGNIIRFSRNYQDFRRMGSFWKVLPFECICSFICLFNLSGLPFSIGFYIKHLILIGLNLNTLWYNFIIVNVLGGAIFGLFYSYRLFYYVFFDFKKSKKIIYMQSNKKNLNSDLYTNTTLASNISIFLLLVVSYVTSIYLFNLFLSKSSVGEGLSIFGLNSIQNIEFNKILINTANNIGLFNWLLLIIIILICLSSWRQVYKNYKILNFIITLVIFFIFFFIFLV